MKKIIFVLLTIGFLFSFNLAGKAQNFKKGIVTLTAQNSHTRSFCFRDNQFVEFLNKSEVTNDCDDITFSFFYKNSFSTAFTTSSLYSGRIANVGNYNELRKKYDYQNSIDDEKLFASIQLKNERSVVLKNVESKRVQRLAEADEIFQGAEFDTVPVKKGSVYIVRFSDDINFSFQRIVKFVVTDFKPNESVTMQWEILFDNQIYNKEKNKQ